jgi:hypothetical protein
VVGRGRKFLKAGLGDEGYSSKASCVRYLRRMGENGRTYRISEVARELGISAMWLRKGEERGFFPPARRDPTNGHRYYTRKDVQGDGGV